MKKAFLLISVIFTLFSCKDGDKYNGLVLVDPNTGIKYLLKYNCGDSYFVDTQEMVVVCKDTTYVFKQHKQRRRLFFPSLAPNVARLSVFGVCGQSTCRQTNRQKREPIPNNPLNRQMRIGVCYGQIFLIFFSQNSLKFKICQKQL